MSGTEIAYAATALEKMMKEYLKLKVSVSPYALAMRSPGQESVGDDNVTQASATAERGGEAEMWARGRREREKA
eukprot:1086387-Rhodomonas_salina.1